MRCDLPRTWWSIHVLIFIRHVSQNYHFNNLINSTLWFSRSILCSSINCIRKAVYCVEKRVGVVLIIWWNKADYWEAFQQAGLYISATFPARIEQALSGLVEWIAKLSKLNSYKNLILLRNHHYSINACF